RIERKAHRERMDHVALGPQRLPGAGSQYTIDIVCRGFMPAELDRGRGRLALKPARRNIDNERVDGQARHPLGCIDGKPDRLFGAIEIDDHTRLYALRFLMTDSDHLDAMRAVAQGGRVVARQQLRDDAADLARAYAEHSDDARTQSCAVSSRPEPAHVLAPLRAASNAALRCSAASGVNRTVSRSSNRMSMARTSRDKSLYSRSRSTSSASAASS